MVYKRESLVCEITNCSKVNKQAWLYHIFYFRGGFFLSEKELLHHNIYCQLTIQCDSGVGINYLKIRWGRVECYSEVN